MKHPFLKYFPPLIKEVFIEETKRAVENNYSDTAYDISTTFMWDSTVLGFEFWEGIEDNLRNLPKK